MKILPRWLPDVLLAVTSAMTVVFLLIAAAPERGSAAVREAPFPEPRPAKAQISEFEMEIVGRQVLVSFDLENAFDDKLVERIASGLATSLTYDFKLVKNRRFWLNRQVATSQLQVVAMYNPMNREYLVNYKQDGNLIDSRVVREASELRRAMTRFENVAVFSLEGYQGILRVRARAELGTGSFLFFIPTLRTTDWAEARIAIRDDGQIEVLNGNTPPFLSPAQLAD